jgi:hypothetical protein
MAYVSATSPLFNRILKEERWLLFEIIGHPITIAQIRAKLPVWDEVLLTITRRPDPDTGLILQCLRAGIKYQHLKTEILNLAIKEHCSSLVEIMNQHAAEAARHKEEERKDLLAADKADKPPRPQRLYEPDAVETQLRHDKWPWEAYIRSTAVQDQARNLIPQPLQHHKTYNLQVTRLFREAPGLPHPQMNST